MNEHDRIVRWIAAHRFPFPDQADWPESYVTITNVGGRVRGVAHAGGLLYPDIVIVDGRSQQIAEIGEVIDVLEPDVVARWSVFSAACKRSSTGARSLFIYAPPGLEEHAQRLLTESAISFAGLRVYSAVGEMVAIAPIITPGDAKDHR